MRGIGGCIRWWHTRRASLDVFGNWQNVDLPSFAPALLAARACCHDWRMAVCRRHYVHNSLLTLPPTYLEKAECDAGAEAQDTTEDSKDDPGHPVRAGTARGWQQRWWWQVWWRQERRSWRRQGRSWWCWWPWRFGWRWRHRWRVGHTDNPRNLVHCNNESNAK